VKLADLNPHMMDKYYRELLKVRSVTNRNVRPKTVAEMLVERKKDIDEYKELFGEEFDDYGLVFCSVNGHPIERQVINRMFNKLIRDNGLPKVVFHSIRHTSITYKLKLNGGDMKAVQRESGLAQVNMVTDVYSHILDEDRKRNAELFEEAFYGKKNLNPQMIDAGSEKMITVPDGVDVETLMKVLGNPEMVALLSSLAKTIQN
jgi:integrase